MELIGMRFARLAPLRALALCAIGAGALLVPDFLDRGLAYAAIGYLLLNGVVLVVASCSGGPRSFASRVGLLTACVLLGLAGTSVVLMQQMQSRVMLYLGLILVEGALYLAVALMVLRSKGLAALAVLLMAGSVVWMLTAPFGGLTNLPRYIGVLLLLSALYELAARTVWKQAQWREAY